MFNNSIELRTLVRERSDPDLRQTRKTYGETDNNFYSHNQTNLVRPRQRPKSLTENIAYNLNSRRHQGVDKDMQTSKKTEKKTGIKEWLFGKTTKTQKLKTNLPPPHVPPIVERLQKQSAYLRATVQKDESVREGMVPANKGQIQSSYSIDEEFRYRKHLLELHTRPTWCDVCEDFIWGLYRSAVRCRYCRYTCHYRCHLDINLDCPKAPVKEKSLEDLTKETLDILNETSGKKAIEDETKITLPANISSLTQLRNLIESHNASSSLIMTLQDDGTFHGFVRVMINLNRPVNVHSDTSDLTMKRALQRSNSKRVSKRNHSVSLASRESSSKDSTVNPDLKQTETLPAPVSPAADSSEPSFPEVPPGRARRSRRMSFYLPKNTKKPLHITSYTTAYEVIEALLDKYGVTDNPHKFSLYERTEENDHIRLRKLEAEERPLVLSLLWDNNRDFKSFSLQENEKGDVVWDAFAIPELKNFLIFLNREEEEMISQVRKKYEDQKRLLQEALDIVCQENPDSFC